MKYLELLGLEVQDKVTGQKGVVTSVDFDLYGCVQVAITPPAKDGKVTAGEWFDVERIDILDKTPVMKQPDFKQGYKFSGVHGASNKLLK